MECRGEEKEERLRRYIEERRSRVARTAEYISKKCRLEIERRGTNQRKREEDQIQINHKKAKILLGK